MNKTLYALMERPAAFSSSAFHEALADACYDQRLTESPVLESQSVEEPARVGRVSKFALFAFALFLASLPAWWDGNFIDDQSTSIHAEASLEGN